MTKQIAWILTFIVGNNNRLYTKLYDERDDFNFHTVNVPFLSSNILSGPSSSSLSGMQDAAHIMMTLDIAINYFLKAIKSTD